MLSHMERAERYSKHINKLCCRCVISLNRISIFFLLVPLLEHLGFTNRGSLELMCLTT
jgi:hypothetical protein